MCSSDLVTFMANDYHIGKKEPTVMYGMAAVLQSAKQEVFLQSPYIVMNKRLKYFMSCLTQKVPRTTILTNSMASSPNLPAFSVYLLSRKWLGHLRNMHIYEFQSKDAIHAKTYIADNHIAFVGSNNLDPRSFNIDTELMLAIDCEAFTQQLKKVVQAYVDSSLELDANGHYIANPKVSEIPVPFIKKCLFRVVGICIWPFKYLL